jgi:NADPH:quinone reductase-like Zn-dependent oxidoreductase
MLIGFAGGIEAEDVATLTPRTLMFGSASLIGVMLAYTADPEMENPFPGIHIQPRKLGETVQQSLNDLLLQGRIQPFVGKTIAFEELPNGLEDMDNRRTVGRTVVTM